MGTKGNYRFSVVAFSVIWTRSPSLECSRYPFSEDRSDRIFDYYRALNSSEKYREYIIFLKEVMDGKFHLLLDQKPDRISFPVEEREVRFFQTKGLQFCSYQSPNIISLKNPENLK